MSSSPAASPAGDLPGSSTVADERKALIRSRFGAAPRFLGSTQHAYRGVIDAYHGETGLLVDPCAAVALDAAWSEIVIGARPYEHRDQRLYDKRQPLVLRKLAAERLFQRLREPGAKQAGIAVTPDDVIVSPYSSIVLLEEALATVARPGGVLVCPEGFYKNATAHIAKFGLRVESSAATADDRFAIDSVELARCLEQHAQRGNLCGVLLTLPGNPVVTDYSLAELTEIGRVLVAARVPVICDMSFDLLSANHIPLAALTVRTAHGPIRLFDRILTITGNSKAFNAFGPIKFGAACTGDSAWRSRIADRLCVSFQRETTHLARAVLENTTDRYLATNRDLLRGRVATARRLVDAINMRAGSRLLRPLGDCDGMFLTVEFDSGLLASAGVYTSSALEEVLLASAGIDCVALDRTGSARLGVRLNVVAPRVESGSGSSDLLVEVFDRIEGMLIRIARGAQDGDSC